MFIVLEGCDGTGKTTLAQQLKKMAEDEFGWTAEIWHRGVPERHPLDEYEDDLLKHYDHSTNHLVIADRWHLGQLVYGGLYRDENLLGYGGAWHVDALLQSIGAVQVILDQPTHIVEERAFAKRGEDYLKRSDIAYVQTEYMKLADRFKASVSLHAGDFDVNERRHLLQRADEQARYAHSLIAFPTYVGPIKPDILLVAETQGNDHSDARAMAPYPHTSGEWLCKTIANTPTFIDLDVGIVNLSEDNIPTLEVILGYPRIVALGRATDEGLSHLETRHGTVPHPESVRRFHATDRAAYATALLEAATIHQKVVPQWR